MADEDHTITVEPYEVEGLADQLDLTFETAGDGLRQAIDRPGYLRYLTDLVEIGEALSRDGAREAPNRFGEALQGYYTDQEATMRQAKGLMSLGARMGLYEGVVV